MKKKKRFSIKLGVGLTVVIVMSVFVTAMLVYVPWMMTSSKNVENMVEQLNSEIIRGVTQVVDSFFQTAIVTQNTIYDAFSNEVVDVDDKQQREQFYFCFLRAHENFSWVSFGFPNGDFFGAQRESEKSLRIIDNMWEGDEKKATRRIDFYEKDGDEINFETSRTIYNYNYFAPDRPWYKKAIDQRDHVWTDVYVFSTSKLPGINSAIALEMNGEFVGVISVAIELAQISSYLKSLKVGKSGTAFIINGKNELIAFQDVDEVMYNVAGQDRPKLKLLGESENSFLKIASAALSENGMDVANIQSQHTLLFSDTIAGRRYFVTLAPIHFLDWVAGTVIPESDFLGEINRNRRNLIIIVASLFVVAAFVAVLISRRGIVKPILKITDQTYAIRDFELENITPVPSAIREINTLSSAMMSMSNGLSSFKKYVPTELVRTLLSQGIEAKRGGVEKNITIFFSDIQAFTKIFEQMGISLVPHLSRYLDEMADVITNNNGVIDKYIGDSIMAFWGAPVQLESHASDACRAALECQRRLHSLRIAWERENKPPLFSRIGVNTGLSLVGNIGSEKKLDYTVIGDPVNVASRLEELNKKYGTSILIGTSTYEQAKDDILCRELDKVCLYGKEEVTDVYELIAMKDEVRISDNYDWIRYYEEGLRLYQSRKWAKAIAFFEKTIVLRNGNDKASNLIKTVCQRYRQHEPDESWDGCTDMRSK